MDHEQLAPVHSDNQAGWKRYFLTPLTTFAQLMPLDPSRGIVVGNRGAGTLQLYSWDVPGGTLRQLTDRPGGMSEVWSDPAGTYAYYLEDEGGNELGHVVRVPLAGGVAEDVTPGLSPYTLRGLHVSLSGNCLAINPVNADGFQIYVLDLGPGDEVSGPRQVYRSEWETWECFPSYGGEFVACQSTARARGARRYTTLVLDTAGGEVVGELNDGLASSVVPWGFSPRAGDFRLVATSTRRGFRQPLLWNPLTGERFDLPIGELRGDLIPLDWSLDGKQLLLLHSYRAEDRLYRYDLDRADLARLDHPTGSFAPLSGPSEGAAQFAPGGEIVAFWQNAARPPEVIALDGTDGRRLRTVLASAEVPPCRPWQSVSLTSSDGESIQGWLGVPDGSGPFPTILEVHGGPHTAIPNIFYPKVQAWLANGFAYFSLNYRGSTTFGRAYMEKIWGDVGHWELEDMVAARNWLVAQGIARPEAILLYGESYGGFLTLWGLGKRPDLWAGGIGVVAGADWVAGYEDSSDALKGAIRCWFGGTPEEKPAAYAASSPITYADQVRAPVLLFQGRNDTRSPAREIELYEARMKALGKEIEVVWFDSGHMSEGPEQELAFMEQMIEFAGRIRFP